MKSFAAALVPILLLLLPGCFDRRLAPVESDESAEAEEHDLGPFQLLDAAATCDDEGRTLALAVVNRDRERDLSATIDLTGATAAGAADAWEVNGPSVSAMNSFESPRVVDVRARTIDAKGARLGLTFPAHSITVVRLPLAR